MQLITEYGIALFGTEPQEAGPDSYLHFSTQATPPFHIPYLLLPFFLHPVHLPSQQPLSSLCAYTDMRYCASRIVKNSVAVLGSDLGLQVPDSLFNTRSRDATYVFS